MAKTGKDLQVNINDKIEYYKTFIEIIIAGYNTFYLNAKNSKLEMDGYRLLEIAFLENFYNGEQLYNDVRNIILNENVTDVNKKYYNIISLEIEKLLIKCNEAFKENSFEIQVIEPPSNINYFSFWLQLNEKYIDFGYFELNKLHEIIIIEIEKTKIEINNLFSIRELNQITNQPTPPQKEIEYQKPTKIDWKKDERLIPYLIHLLNENGFLSEKNQFSFIEKHFTANGKPIKRENIKANYNQADYLGMKPSKYPKEIKQINDIMEQLKIILDALE